MGLLHYCKMMTIGYKFSDFSRYLYPLALNCNIHLWWSFAVIAKLCKVFADMLLNLESI